MKMTSRYLKEIYRCCGDPVFINSKRQGIHCRYNRRKYSSSGDSVGDGSYTRPAVTVLTQDESLVKNAVSAFANNELRPHLRDMENNREPSQKVIDAMFENKYLSVEIPVEYGGAELPYFCLVLIMEELAKIDMGIAIMATAQNSMVNTLIRRHGSLEQKQKYLPLLAKNMLSSVCISEPDTGSDAFAMRTRARLDGSHYILNGSKMWVTNAKQSGLFAILANTDPSMGYKGISIFLVERDIEGLTVGKAIRKVGLKTCSTCPVYLEDCKVPVEMVLGGTGEGYKLIGNCLNASRVPMAGLLLGVAEGCLDHTITYLLERKQGGQTIWNYQGVNHPISSLCAEVEAARTLVYNTARLAEAGYDVLKQSSMAKYYASELACRVTSKCMDLMGGAGVTEDYLVEKYYRDSKIGTILEGTSNIMLNTIAKSIAQEYST